MSTFFIPHHCQITTEAAAEILADIEKLDMFADVKKMGFEDAVCCGKIQYISDDVLTAFMEKVKGQSVLFGEEVKKDVAIVYSPLNGTGYLPVTQVLQEMGYTNITLVEEQRLPDGNFPTCPYPNPEVKEAMKLGMEYAAKHNADLLLATDPDCDRVGIAVKDKDAVGGAYLICEMFSYYATQGVDLLDKLNELFEKYGYCLNTLHSYEFNGSAGFRKMQKIMKTFHNEVGEGLKIESFAGKKIHTVLDYSKGLDGLPKSDVLKYLMDGNCSIVVRPSGTEPKLKTYISVLAKTKEEAVEIEKNITKELDWFFK